ncbi:MAG TPA: aminodeoxychorismate/anthranilate synthase component II, partial [candidate division Zixibacteria bacterium]|nr:aminodeoxychorismate/anthranilate synthase component II [candidate division Zixibacteria bacterium]
MIDNYDSFTYNLVQYLSELGAELHVARNDELTVDEALALPLQGIVVSPGPGRPEGAGVTLALIKRAAGRVPLLGVCLGHQALAQAFGGVIDYAPSLMHGKTSEVTHQATPLFAGVTSPFTATRYHSLVVQPDSLPKEFTATAHSDDGVIMAIEAPGLGLYGVQFHPESIMTPA